MTLRNSHKKQPSNAGAKTSQQLTGTCACMNLTSGSSVSGCASGSTTRSSCPVLSTTMHSTWPACRKSCKTRQCKARKKNISSRWLRTVGRLPRKHALGVLADSWAQSALHYPTCATKPLRSVAQASKQGCALLHAQTMRRLYMGRRMTTISTAGACTCAQTQRKQPALLLFS